LSAAPRPCPEAHPARARRGALLAFAASLLVAGCGQRGPLYLPENAPPPRRRRTEPQQAPAPTESRR